MNLMTYLYKQSKWLLPLAVLVGLLSGLSGAGLAVVISKSVASIGQLNTLAGLFFALCLIQVISKSCSEILMLNIAQHAIYDMRTAISRRLLLTPLKKIQELGKPALLVILTRDVDTFIQALLYFPQALGNGVVILFCLGYIGQLSWAILLVLSLTMLSSMVGFHLAERIPLKRLRAVREQTDVLYKHFRGLIEGSKELQLNAERGRMFVNDVLAPDALKFKNVYVRGLSEYTWVVNVGNIIFYFVIGVMLFVVPRWMPQSLEVIYGVVLVLLYLIRPISDIMSSIPLVRQGSIALKRINQLESDLRPVLPAAELPPPPASFSGGALIELKNVTHRYAGTDQREFLLGPINLTVRHGEILFIVGGNGSGKTTLAMLLLGLYEPESGVIFLNNQIVSNDNLSDYRKNFSAVFSDFYLFEQLLTNQDPDLAARAARYLDLMGIGDKVSVVKGRFTTTELSTGQRKRLALVVAYLEDRPIYLFDEWAADQDPVFKKVFYKQLLPDLCSRGKTVLVITHDDAYFKEADRVIKLEDGLLREITHTALPALSQAATL